MKLKKKIISAGIIVSTAPILAVLACGNAATGEGDNYSQSSELAPDGFHAEKVPHGEHFHTVYIPDGKTWKDIYGDTHFDADAVMDFPNHKIPENAFVNVKMGEIDEMAKIKTIGKGAFAHADLSPFDGTTMVENEDTGTMEVAPSLFELLKNVDTIEEGAFNNAILPKGFDVKALRDKHGENTFVHASVLAN
ncbi:MAG: hypothetical protein HRT99_01245 [Mycoplasmatales bacterium]|nr:hypothetical protein [Mycoplasmatales bacterium]